MTSTGTTSPSRAEEDDGELFYPLVKWISQSRTYWCFKDGSIALWSSLVLMIVDTLLISASIGTTEWGKIESSHESGLGVIRYQGLWMLCHSVSGCSTMKPDSITGAMRTCQAFAVMALISLLLSVIATPIFVLVPSSRENISFKRCVLLSRLMNCLFLILLVSIFASYWFMPNFTSKDYRKTLVAGFDLAISGIVFEVIGSFLLLVQCYYVSIEDKEDFLRSAEVILGGPPQRSSSTRGLTTEEHYNVSYGAPPARNNPSVASDDAYEDIQRLRSAISRNRNSYASSVPSEYNEQAWHGVKPKTGQNGAVGSVPPVTSAAPVAPSRAKRKARYDAPVEVHHDQRHDTSI